MPVGASGSGYMSGPKPSTVIGGLVTIKSGSSPNCHASPAGKTRGGGASFGSPFGAPVSTHFAMIATSSSLSDGSGEYSPTERSKCHGGMKRETTLSLIDRAHGRESSYVSMENGAI